MDRFKQLETFVSVATRGSLSAAARAEDVAPAVISRRLDALEARLGVKLLVRTTRRLVLTQEGNALFEEGQRILAEMARVEASVSAGGGHAAGHLRITAPAGFGRRHVAPLVTRFRARHPEITLSLNLTDRIVDLINEEEDCAIRIGELPDSSLVSVRLADNRRLCVASPDYLARRGMPDQPSDLDNHDCLALTSEASQVRGWAFTVGGRLVHQRISGPLDCTDGQVLHEWCLSGLGIAWRSIWEVEDDLRQGRLVSVLAPYAAPPNGIFAVFAQRKHQPLRLRLWLDFIRTTYGNPAYWSPYGD